MKAPCLQTKPIIPVSHHLEKVLVSPLCLKWLYLKIQNRLHIEPNHERTSPRSEANRTIPTQISNDIYERHLILKNRGFPLWIPGPKRSLHLDYRRTGVRIGDVGIITPDGGFSFFFNICLPHDHPVNPRILPEHFAPISPPIEATDIDDLDVYTGYSHLASASSSLSTAISCVSIYIIIL